MDTSVLVAILADEPETSAFVDLLSAADIVFFSAAGLLEARMVLHGRNPALPDDLDKLLYRMRIQIAPVTAAQSDLAFDAFRRYGKGTGHKAGLNFGDCFAYALAKDKNAPLLFKGNDFIHTDIAGI